MEHVPRMLSNQLKTLWLLLLSTTKIALPLPISRDFSNKTYKRQKNRIALEKVWKKHLVTSRLPQANKKSSSSTANSNQTGDMKKNAQSQLIQTFYRLILVTGSATFSTSENKVPQEKGQSRDSKNRANYTRQILAITLE